MTVKNGKFDICAECGAHLDSGEKCTCDEDDHQGQTEESEK